MLLINFATASLLSVLLLLLILSFSPCAFGNMEPSCLFNFSKMFVIVQRPIDLLFLSDVQKEMKNGLQTLPNHGKLYTGCIQPTRSDTVSELDNSVLIAIFF